MTVNYAIHFAVFLLVLPNFSIGEECDVSGKKCISCFQYQKCNAGVPLGEIYSCKNDKDGDACADPELEECRLKLNCMAGSECIGAGIFPDAVDESNFYVCTGDPFLGFIKYEFTCQEEHYFDSGSNSCVPKAVTESTVAPETSPETTTVVSSTSTPETTTVATSTEVTITTTVVTSTETTPTTTVATSTEATPTTTVATTTEATPTTTVATSVETTPTTTVATTLEPTLPSTTPLTTTMATTTASPPVACTLSGIFPFPSNCKMYYRCSTSLKAFYYVCPGASYFNENILKCSMTISPACQEQILKNTTTATTSTPLTTTAVPSTTTTITTPPPTTTPATTTTTPLPKTTPSTTTPPPTTTTTPPSPTTTPAPVPTTPTSPGSFSCPSAGTFANTVSCKTYFRCSTVGKVFVFTCPGESYYNEFTRRCSLVMTPRCQQLLQV